MNSKVLVTDKVHFDLIEGLEKLGYEVEYLPDFNPEKLDAVLPSLTGIIINSKIKMNAHRLDLSDKLKFIGRLGSGLEIIDLEYAKKKNIAVFNSPEGNRNAVAEHAMGMLLCLSNNLLKADEEVRQMIWNRESNRGFELAGLTMGIIGFGNTGQAFARKLSGWALNVICCDPYVLNISEDLEYIRNVSFEHLVKEADIISLHVPLTDETKWMINENTIKLFKPGAILINTSRGPVVKTKDLIQALEKNKLKGACLDVFENEKPHTFSSEEYQQYLRLYDMKNVVLSPHVAGWTIESLRKIAETLVNRVSELN